MSLASELSLPAVLQKLVDLAGELVSCRYSALSVLGSQGEIEQFLFSGITQAQRERIGDLPRGRGLLGVLLREGSTLRIQDISKDPRSAGFPPHHPPMRSLLGVPVISRGRIIGNLYLTEKQGAVAFDEMDEEIVRLLATQAAIAIRNAELYAAEESLARLEERERIAMDLHDGVIQSVYAVALHIEDCAERLQEAPQEAKPVLDKAMDDLHQVIKDIRSYIFDLRPRVSEVADLPEALRQLVDEVRVNTLIDAKAEIAEPFDGGLSDDEALALFHVAQEALNNVTKHSRASAVRLKLDASDGQVMLEIQDNGTGFEMQEEGSGEKHGVRNMRDRARALGASLFLDSQLGEGTIVRLELPVGQRRGRAHG